MMRWLGIVVVAVIGCGLVGCSAGGGQTFTVGPGEYAAAFEAAKRELHSAGFELDRVDARAGVVTSRVAASSGLATLWIQHDSTIGQSVEGILNHQVRRARVVFSPADRTDGVADDLRLEDSIEMVGRVEVEVLRVYRAGVRPAAASIQASGLEIEPGSDEPVALAPVAVDEELAARLARKMRQRLRGT